MGTYRTMRYVLFLQVRIFEPFSYLIFVIIITDFRKEYVIRANKTHYYTVEFALAFDDANPSSVLNKLDKIAICIYNDVLGESLKRLHRVQHDKNYQDALERLSNINQKSSLTRIEQIDRKQQYDIIKQVCKEYGYTENDLHAYVAKGKRYFHDALGIHECQKLATRAFHATENARFKKNESCIQESKKRLISD